MQGKCSGSFSQGLAYVFAPSEAPWFQPRMNPQANHSKKVSGDAQRHAMSR
jgi:hypothetical protein